MSDKEKIQELEKRIKDLEAKLKVPSKQIDRYIDLFEKTKDAILIIENEMFVDCNQATVEMLKYNNKEELLQTHPSELSPEFQPDGQKSLIKADKMMEIAMANGSHRFEWDHKDANGKVFPVEVLLTSISNDEGKRILHTVWRDITNRKNAIKSLQDSEDKFRTIFDNTPLGVFYFDQDGVILDCNESFVKIIGSDKKNLIGLNMIKDLKDVQLINEIKRSLVDGWGEYESEYESVTADKRTPVRVILRGINYVDGKYSSGVGLVEDISIRKEWERALLESEAKFRSLFMNAGDAMIIVEKNGIISDVNISFQDITDLGKEDILNQHISIIFPESELIEKPLRFSDVDKGLTVVLERNVIGRSSQIPVEMNTRKLDEKRYISIMRDLTERKKAEEEIIIAKEKAEESDKLKSAFLANMSHEIRTPMNGIIGFSDILMSDGLEKEERNKYLSIIKNNSEQLLSIITSIIDISNIEVKQVKIYKEDFSLKNLLEEKELFFKMQAAQMGKENIDVKLNNLVDVPDRIYHNDHVKISQVLDNLINNALKFTIEGSVNFGVSSINESEYTFFVQDTGVGIPKAKKEIIFERFRQLDSDRIRNNSGIGLGLSICKGLIELMDGKIWLESLEGKGSIFFFKLKI